MESTRSIGPAPAAERERSGGLESAKGRGGPSAQPWLGGFWAGGLALAAFAETPDEEKSPKNPVARAALALQELHGNHFVQRLLRSPAAPFVMRGGRSLRPPGAVAGLQREGEPNGAGSPQAVPTAGGSVKAAGSTRITESRTTYSVKANTLKGAAAEIEAREEAGETTWLPTFTVTKDDDGNVTSATVSVPVTILMPNWPSAAKLKPADKAVWDAFVAALEAHEQGHVALVREHLGAVHSGMAGKSEAEAGELFQEKLTALQSASDDFDARTDHGRNTGTTITIPAEETTGQSADLTESLAGEGEGIGPVSVPTLISWSLNPAASWYVAASVALRSPPGELANDVVQRALRPTGGPSAPLHIQRQHVQVASGRSVGSLEGATTNRREDVLYVMDRLHVLWSLTNAEYSAEYPVVGGRPSAANLSPSEIPRTIAGLKKNAEPHLHNEPARAVFNIGISAPVGVGQANAKGDIQALQAGLRSKGLLPDAAFQTESKAVEAGPERVAEKDIPQTIAAIGRLKMSALSGAPDLFPGAAEVTPDKKTEVDKALNPDIPRTASGALAEFKDVVGGRTYRQDLEAVLDVVRKRLYPRSKKILDKYNAGKKLPMGRFQDIGLAAKNVTDELFGKFATGPALKAGTRASGANLLDRSLEPGDAVGLVAYLITKQREVLPIHKNHNAMPDDQSRPEAAIVNRIISSYSTKYKAEMEAIDQAWPGQAFRGVVEIQPIEADKKPDQRRLFWYNFQVLIHEYLHTITHPNFYKVVDDLGGTRSGILVEGGTSMFTDEVWKNIFPGRIAGDAALRASVEGGVEPYDANVIPKIGHYAQISDARKVAAIVGDDNFKAAYFHGRTEMIGFPTAQPMGWVTAKPSQQFEVPPNADTLADVAFMTGAKVEDIASLNALPVDAKVRPGQVLLVPG